MKFFSFFFMLISMLSIQGRYLRRHSDDTFQDDGLNFETRNESKVMDVPEMEKDDGVLTLARERNETESFFNRQDNNNSEIHIFIFIVKLNENKMQPICKLKEKPVNLEN